MLLYFGSCYAKALIRSLDLATPEIRKFTSQIVLPLLDQSSAVKHLGTEFDSESSDDEEALDSEPTSIDEVLSQLNTAIECLNDLNASLDAANSDTPYDDVGSTTKTVTIEDIAPHKYFSQSIHERFPMASDTIAEHLGKANFRRYQMLHDRRYTVQEASEPILVSDTKSKPGMSEFQDSGYGSAVRQSLIAPSIASSIFSGASRSERSKYPQLPESAKTGNPFNCAACGKSIVALRSGDYRLVQISGSSSGLILITNRRHLIQDLCPYTCIVETCKFSSTPFQSRKVWVEHINLEHPDCDLLVASVCPLCSKSLPDEKNGLFADLAKHLEEISLSALPQDVESEASDSEHDDASELPKGFQTAISTSIIEREKSKGGNTQDASIEIVPVTEPHRFEGEDDLLGSLERHLGGDASMGGMRTSRQSGAYTELSEQSDLESTIFLQGVKENPHGVMRETEEVPGELNCRDTILQSASRRASNSSEKTKNPSKEEPGQTILQDPHHVIDILDEYESTTSPLKEMNFLETAGISLHLAAEMPQQSETYDPLLQHPIASKLHKCPYCDATFTRHHNLKSHLLTHSQEKPYECSQCLARFRRLHDLKRHAKLHTGERPHECPKCGRKFARGDALAKHTKGPGGCSRRKPSFEDEEPPYPFSDSEKASRSGTEKKNHVGMPSLSDQKAMSLLKPPIQSSSPDNSARQSRKQCDGCKRRKSRCVFVDGEDKCVLCDFHKQKCDFSDPTIIES